LHKGTKGDMEFRVSPFADWGFGLRALRK